MNNSAVVINEVPMLQKLDKLIDLRDNAFVDFPEQPADSINDWLTINFLLSINCRQLGFAEIVRQTRIRTSGDPGDEDPYPGRRKG